ncbi:MAG: hypothetical protein FJ303_23605 [Planctomycetes bacterium]|nr:hypothetical protein [Planctomycetota bacterium]
MMSPFRCVSLGLVIALSVGRAGAFDDDFQFRVESNLRAGVVGHVRPTNGVRDPIRAGVLLLDNGDTRAAIVTLDLIEASSDMVAQLREAIAEKTKTPAKNILVATSHNHSGPGWSREYKELSKTGILQRSADAGQTWNKLNVPGTAYYPRSVQSKDGRIFVLGHVGGDDPYGKVDQSIVMDSFRLVAADLPAKDRASPPSDTLTGERIPLGDDDDYKPCLVMLPSGELILVAFHQHKRGGNKVMEQNLLFRSKDGGKSWSKAEKLDLLGREPYLTLLKDGTLFITGHLLANDVRNQWGYTCGFLHRSTDRGKTWESIRVESEGIKPKASNHTTRNVLQLADGTLLLGVDYDGGDGPFLMWRSKDNGKTWDKTVKCEPKDFKSKYGFFGGETWLWQAKSGKIWALVRVDSNELPIKDKPITAKNDQADHCILFSSKDEGKTFDRIRDFGDYGEMYMSLLRLQDKRLLLTFTVRDLRPSLGVRAIVGTETGDGFEFDFSKDRIMLDTRTPIGKYQGGGFGPTVQLKDGTLVTSYSYRGADDKTHLEVVRWKPPTRIK